jgi:hypothetical protein
MRYAAVCTVGLLMSSLAVPGQSKQPAQSAELTRTLQTSTCPISMRARHAFMTQRELASDQRSPHSPDKMTAKEPGMALRLTLKGSDNRRIASAQVKVSGLKSDGHTLLLTSEKQVKGAKIFSKTMGVSFARGEDGTVDAYFTAPGFTSVRSIALLTVTYSDGSTWTLQTANGCSVEPDPLMLIADQ